MIHELDNVVLETDLPKNGLKRGDIGTVVMLHNAGKGAEVEFVALDGETVAVVTLPTEQFRPIRRREIAHVRHVA
ncbi:MAG: DUF4926 domain-containing protein [Nitrospinae bacterium]|nr:DUF4926 domain-containing protein [Nitrospinota bacterium]